MTPRVPRRLQLRRTKGWRLPEGARSVARPTKWGNPYRVGDTLWWSPVDSNRGKGAHLLLHELTLDQAAAVLLFRSLAARRQWMHGWYDDVREDLRGCDLACWCHLCALHADGKPLGVECAVCEPCHADVLLDVANSAAPIGGTP